MGFISKFILPKEVDFNASLQAQVVAVRDTVQSLYDACVYNDDSALAAIDRKAQHARELKHDNMKELLDVFITPYDKESIYRIITQLDWVALSVKHFQLEIHVYGIHSLQSYQEVLAELVKMAGLLEEGITELSGKKLRQIAEDIDRVHDLYDHVVSLCAEAMATLLEQKDCKRIIRHKEMLAQLKEIAKRIQVTANTLEDMAIKAV